MSETVGDTTWSFHLLVGFRNGRFVAYLRDPVQTSPATLYHRLNSSGSGALRSTYDPQLAAAWAREYPTTPEVATKLSWIGKTPAELGLRRQFWLLSVDEDNHFTPLNHGRPWPADCAEQALSDFLEENEVKDPQQVIAQEADPTARSIQQDFV